MAYICHLVSIVAVSIFYNKMNPWLQIPAADYDSHMSLPDVAQAQALNKLMARALKEYTPNSIAVIGCTTGNGFEHTDRSQTHRVVGVDINPAYLKELKARFAGKIPCLQLIEADVSSADLQFEPVSLVFAGLIFEYVDVMESLNSIYISMVSGGILITVLQLPSFESSPVTATRYKSLELLEPVMNLIPPSAFSSKCNSIGLKI